MLVKNINFVFNRAVKLILNSKTEWNSILTETLTRRSVIKNYALPWMVIMVVCCFIGESLFESRNIFSIQYVLTKGIIIFAVTYIGIYVSSLIINELTTSFNSKKDTEAVFKLVIYSCTGYFIASSLTLLLPPLPILMAFALYSLYLFWEGSTILLGTPDDNKVGFVVVSSLIMLGIYAILSLIINNILHGIFGLNLLIQ
jgi:Na+/melibiose symporter-like transporter